MVVEPVVLVMGFDATDSAAGIGVGDAELQLTLFAPIGMQVTPAPHGGIPGMQPRVAVDPDEPEVVKGTVPDGHSTPVLQNELFGQIVPTATVTPGMQFVLFEQLVPIGTLTPGIQFVLFVQLVPIGTFTPGIQLELPEMVAVVLAEPLRPTLGSLTVTLTEKTLAVL
ncbi:MAG: hypothetical protein ACR2PL_14385 [Dehalococcoidia bacterium]